MNKTIKTTIHKRHADRLSRLAMRYGLSLDGFVSRILSEISDDIPEESLSDYTASRVLSSSIKRGIADWENGRLSTKL